MKKLLVICVLLFSTQALAGSFFVAPQLGTLGGGLNAGYAFNEKMGIRANLNYLKFGLSDRSVDEVNYSADLKNLTFGALVDWHPMGGGFKVSAGAYLINLEVDMEGKVDDSVNYKIGNNTYTGSNLGKITGSADWNKFAPYLGIGWGKAYSSGLGFHMDLGILYLSGVSVGYTIEHAVLGSILKDDADLEAQKVKDKMDDYRVYPVLSLGVAYQF